jgi:hypothetical protein
MINSGGLIDNIRRKIIDATVHGEPSALLADNVNHRVYRQTLITRYATNNIFKSPRVWRFGSSSKETSGENQRQDGSGNTGIDEREIMYWKK